MHDLESVQPSIPPALLHTMEHTVGVQHEIVLEYAGWRCVRHEQDDQICLEAFPKHYRAGMISAGTMAVGALGCLFAAGQWEHGQPDYMMAVVILIFSANILAVAAMILWAMTRQLRRSMAMSLAPLRFDRPNQTLKRGQSFPLVIWQGQYEQAIVQIVHGKSPEDSLQANGKRYWQLNLLIQHRDKKDWYRAVLALSSRKEKAFVDFARELQLPLHQVRLGSKKDAQTNRPKVLEEQFHPAAANL